MTDEQKRAVHGAAGKVAGKANKAAQAATGWKKWVLALGAVVAGAIAYFTAV